MSTPLLLRAFVNERLTAAAEEIFGVFERTIAKYEEEVSYSQQEIKRLRRLLLDYSQKTDPLQPVCKEETPTEQHHCIQVWSPSVGQRNPEPLYIKEEEQELWTSQQEQQVQEFKEVNILYLPPSTTWVKNEQDSSPSLQPQIQNNESGEHLQELQETKIIQLTLPLTATSVKNEQDSSPSLQPRIQNNESGEHLQELQETKIIQLTLPLTATSVENEQDPTPSSQAQIHDNESVQDGSESERPEPALNTLKLKETPTDKSPRSLITSMETTELPPTPDHCCYLCEKPFVSTQHLINHVQRIHSKEAGVLCGVCGKKLASTDSLTAHLNTHKGSRVCHVCGKHCNSKTCLTEHMAGHAGVKLHRCHVCGKECSRKGDMTIHMRIHTGEKPFCCSFCCKSFTHSGHLRKHMRSHTGERPHRCEVCGRGFLQSTHLKCHLRTHAQKY